ncbi:hypothetical protein [Kineococcus glutinatus]|uniref:Uncharacterized protein n=1 Tax=Kineococcus glutinatus TaxID=1070872 RepID=A0ABP9HDG5_9ACTN
MKSAPVDANTPTTIEYRRRALHHLAVPGDDGGELASHLVSRYLLRLRQDLHGGEAFASAPPSPPARDLLDGLAALFSAIADRRCLTADDPALQALARLLLEQQTACSAQAPGRDATGAAGGGIPAARPRAAEPPAPPVQQEFLVA